MKKIIHLAFLLSLSIIIPFFPAGTGLSETETAPGFTLPDLSGKMTSLKDYKGQVVLLNFWATWCPPCKAEIPDFIKLQEKYGPKGFQVLGVSFDNAAVSRVKEFSEQRNITYKILYAGKEVTRISGDYGNIRAIPTSFLLDRQGRIVKKFVGVIDKQVWEREIELLL